MKYAIVLNGSEKAVNFAKRVETELETGGPVNWLDQSTNMPIHVGAVHMVGWPVVDGEPVKTGEAILLMEGSIFKGIRNWFVYKLINRMDFIFGWPRNLQVTG